MQIDMVTMNAGQLRASLPSVVRRVGKGSRFLVTYRNRPAFQILPVAVADLPSNPPRKDALYHAPAVGRSRGGKSARQHEQELYGA
jgi:antitoxin (DNA-binding transcriptional repressor) of toxin-antitoxin stability system